MLMMLPSKSYVNTKIFSIVQCWSENIEISTGYQSFEQDLKRIAITIDDWKHENENRCSISCVCYWYLGIIVIINEFFIFMTTAV